ncbi:MAG: fibronectin type III domain-containing protein [Deltaproteobacteria bacterium]|nr:fibronectin type III domain-containing protein [Deltaproteobacteria bacterium]
MRTHRVFTEVRHGRCATLSGLSAVGLPAGRTGLRRLSLVSVVLVSTMAAGLLAGCPSNGGTKGQGDDAGMGADGGQTADGGRGGDADAVDGSNRDGSVASSDFARVWVHVGETSAVVFWQRADIAMAGTSYVEYGLDGSYGSTTDKSADSRRAQFHRITGLQPATTYHFRMVLDTGDELLMSEDRTFTTEQFSDAIRVPADVTGPPYVLDRNSGFYVVTEDLTAPGTAIEITGSDVVVELDGHTVTFATSSSDQVRGIHIHGDGRAVVRNGVVVQGDAGGDYSTAVESRWRSEPAEIYGMSIWVKGPNAHPLRLFGSAQDAEIHHNVLYSTVMKIESRHYPGNCLLRVDASGPNISVHDNILIEGVHRGIVLSGDEAGDNIEIAYNDIQHHARYVNGYAIAAGGPAGVDIHHNRITSMGRGIHITRPHTLFHDNYMDIRGHMTLDDEPPGSAWQERMIELHGVKFEGDSVTDAKVYDNFVRIVQYLPDDEWEYVPATPLNIACYDPNAGNDVYDNTFVALTWYDTPRHGGYGDSGQWASPIYLVHMNQGPADSGGYSIFVHDNEFFTNDLYVSADLEPDMTIRIEGNTFTLVDTPSPMTEDSRFRRITATMQSAIEGANTFVEQ